MERNVDLVVVGGGPAGLAAACAAQSIAPAEAERRINELSFDAVGDAVIEGGEVIPDYDDDIRSAINMNGG